MIELPKVLSSEIYTRGSGDVPITTGMEHSTLPDGGFIDRSDMKLDITSIS